MSMSSSSFIPSWKKLTITYLTVCVSIGIAASNHQQEDHPFYSNTHSAEYVQLLADEIAPLLPLDQQTDLTIMFVGEDSGTTSDPGGNPPPPPPPVSGSGKKLVLEIYQQVIDNQGDQYLLGWYGLPSEGSLRHQVMTVLDATGNLLQVHYLGKTMENSKLMTIAGHDSIFLAGSFVVVNSEPDLERFQIRLFQFEAKNRTATWERNLGGQGRNLLTGFNEDEQGHLILNFTSFSLDHMGDNFQIETSRSWEVAYDTQGDLKQARSQ